MKRISIITGASSGMGKEFAKQIAAKNNVDELWILARRQSKLAELRDEILSFSKISVRIIEIDLSGKKGVTAFKAFLDIEKKIDEKIGGFCISTLVNNAGFGTYGTFETTPLEKELNMIDLNCTTLTGLCGLSLEYMRKDSVIINVASLGSFLPLGNFAVYAASKAYVLSFSVGLAAELHDKGIQVTALCPGPVSTEFANIASNGKRVEVLHGKSAEKVVSHCLKCVEKGKHIAIMAFKWKFKAFASRFVGRYFGSRFTYKYCKRPS